MMKFKKTLSLFLALVMCLGLVNFSAFADTTDPVDVPTVTDETLVEPKGNPDAGLTPAGEDGSDGNEQPASNELPTNSEMPTSNELPTSNDLPVESNPVVEDDTVAVTGVTLDQGELSLAVGDEAVTLAATVAPENATNKTVTWSSDNEAVATVVDGAVTAVAAGTAIITVTTEDGEFTATCEVTVTAAEQVETGDLYVSDSGDDANDGTKDHPFATLAKAVDTADELPQKAVTIVLLSDLTSTKCARINGKDVTIKGNGYTITRGETFDQIQDNARSTYNPAMIEVCNSKGSPTASLRLENITLDDGQRTAGTKYSQASTNGKGGNGDIVQDGIIATYDGVGTITLGNNVTLNGYGGMSAVRLSGGTLTMESGSLITGGKNFTTRDGGNGPAGAIWSQGGTLIMNEGAKIDGAVGRAVYLDGSGSNATINGTISNITPNSNMWQGTDGVAMHVRNESSAVLSSTGKIKDIEGGSCALSIISSSFEASKGSEISNLKNTRVANANGAKEEDKNPHIVLFDGEVKDCTYADVQFWAWYARYIVGPNANIHDTTASKTTIGMFYLQNGGELNVHGKIQDNNNTVVYMGNQGGTGTCVRVYDGGYIHKNRGYGIYANNSGHVEIYGGEISENTSYGVYVRSKKDWKDASLNMTGGKIINNGSAGISYITYTGSSYSKVDITGGEISGNGYSSQISISGANAEDALNRCHIAEGVVKATEGKAAMINTSFGQLTLDANYKKIDLGNAKAAASDKINELVSLYQKGQDATDSPYVTKGSALWFRPTEDTLHFKASRAYGINSSNYLMVGYIPLKADGTPKDGAELTVKGVDNTATVDVTLDGLSADQPYALMWIVPNEDVTGVLNLTTSTPEVSEVLDQEAPYTVDYTLKYELKNLSSSIKPGDAFTATITLDENLNLAEKNPVTFSSSYFEQAGETLYSYDKDNHTVTVAFKALDKKFYSFSSVTIKLNTTFDGEVFDKDFENDIKQLSTTAALVSSTNPDGTLSFGTSIKLDTPLPAVTDLVPLPKYTVTFDTTGGSAVEAQKVKEGTKATKPTTDPTRSGYTFTGWFTAASGGEEFDFDAAVTADITVYAQWRSNGGGGSSGGGGTNIEDEDPPLANVDGNLNTTDHYAYIIGRGENCVQPLENITRAEVATIFFRLLTEDFRVANWSTVSSFPDVEAGAWYATEIATAERAGILKGCDDGNMQPDRDITRAEFTVMAIRFLNGSIEDDGVGDFADTADHWAAKEIRLAAKAGWIKGYGNNFRPNDPITRAEAMTIINRMLDRVPGETFPAGVIEWEDNPKGAWYYADVMEATNGHDYEREEGSVVEKWTALTPYRDWIALEAEWTANNGASAPASEEK